MHSSSINTSLVEELHERSFVVLPSAIDPKQLFALGGLSEELPRMTDGSDAHYGLAEYINDKWVCHLQVEVHNGFSVFQVDGRFLELYTNVVSPPSNAPLSRRGRISPERGDIFALAPKGIDGFGELSYLVRQDVYEEACRLNQRLPDVMTAINASTEVMKSLGLEELFSNLVHARNMAFELSHYECGSTVGGIEANVPVHTDNETCALVVSIPLVDRADQWIIGRNSDRLEIVTQSVGDMVVMDVDDVFSRQAPIHHPLIGDNTRDALIIIARGDARYLVIDALEKRALETEWKPTPMDDRHMYNGRGALDLRTSPGPRTRPEAVSLSLPELVSS